MTRFALYFSALACATAGTAVPAFAQQATSTTAASTAENNTGELQEVVVTGVLIPQAAASVAVSTMTAARIEQLTPTSAVDLLRNVPGIFVNSALGEIRSVVYSRGISANSTEAAAGYYYVSLQEDGLPVSNVTFNNYGPDFFYRQDLSLERLEALRGGTATVTGPNAPGGIFNYLSKTGKSSPGVELRVRSGLEGDGRNPYYRGDFVAGGAVRDDLYYSVSGFYRKSDGPRDPGYDFNRGGQIKGNLLWEYEQGSVQLYAKYLDDHNVWNEFLPARDFNDPKLAPGISRYDSLLIPRSPHDFVETADGPTRHWDGNNLAHSTSQVIGIKNQHEFGDRWTVRNNLKYSDNKAEWNTSALTFAVPITDGFTNILLNANAPGTYSYRNHSTGELLAQVQNAGGVRSVLLNNLPNQQAVPNGVVTEVAFNFNPHAKEVMDELSVSKEFDRGSFTVGSFFANSDVSQHGGGAGMGLAVLQNQPSMLDITLTTPGGAVQQITSPEGFAGIGQRFAGNPFKAEQRQISVFAGGAFKFTDRLTFDGALRHDDLRTKGANNVAVANPNPALGGLDGNPATLYDNFAVTYTSPFNYSFGLDYNSYSSAFTYELNQENAVYVRYSNGKKAPDVQFFLGYDTLPELQGLKPVPQEILQIEAGYRYGNDTVRAKATPFYSKLSNVGSAQIGTNADGTAYFPPTLFSTTETYGIEIEADADVGLGFNLRTALTVQDSKSKDFSIWVFGAGGPADDTVSSVPDGEADNAAKLMATTTLQYTPSQRLTGFLSWRYLGKRAANRYNSFYLPAYSEVDFGTTFHVTDHFTVAANVNNLFNTEGVLSFAPAGTLLSALDRQALTPAQVASNPNQLFSILENQPRAYFLTLGYTF